MTRSRPERLAYGSAAQQFGELTLPAATAPRGVVTLVHGGFWRARYGLDLMRPLAQDLAARGWAAWNLEYRRVGQPGGGWPGTFDDVRAGLERVGEERARVELTRHVVVGHSAGGTLALWLATNAEVLAGPVAPTAVVSLAGVCDLAEAERNGTGDGAVADLLDGDLSQAEAASPAPHGDVPTLLLHGSQDTSVPPSQSRGHAERLRARGVEVTLIELAGVTHRQVIDPAHDAWREVLVWIDGPPHGGP